jgi:two-component system nitrogen regulation sensor histidine kinase NtrY
MHQAREHSVPSRAGGPIETPCGKRLHPSQANLARLHMRKRLLLALMAVVGLAVLATMATSQVVRSPMQQVAVTVLLAVPLAGVIVWMVMRPVRDLVQAVSDGLLSYREGDFTMRLAVGCGGGIGDIVQRFNALGDMLSNDRNANYQKHMIFETVLQSAPASIVLCDEAGYVMYANSGACELFNEGNSLEGADFTEVLVAMPEEMRDALESGQDSLFTVGREAEVDTYHVVKRYFEIKTQLVTFYMIETLSREMARQEVEVWKRAIRVISHEINNTLAPVSSLVHSAKTIAQKPEHAHKLTKIFDTIEERTGHLKSFLQSYARFAQLPRPMKSLQSWSDLLESVRPLYSFEVEDAVPEVAGYFDATQMQQVLINLLKNAYESGSAHQAIQVRVRSTDDGGAELAVLDRGSGISDEALKKVLLPFYSTKKQGQGLGLSLSREIVDAHGGRLSIHRREGGGTMVRCVIPGAAPQTMSAEMPMVSQVRAEA